MDGWERWVDGWMNGRDGEDGWMDGRVGDGWMNGRDGRMDG